VSTIAIPKFPDLNAANPESADFDTILCIFNFLPRACFVFL